VITYDTGFAIGQWFCTSALPPLVLLVLIWKFTRKRLSFLAITLAVAACLGGWGLGGIIQMLVALRFSGVSLPTLALPVLLFAVPFLLTGLAGWLVLASLKVPAPRAALGGLLVFLIPYAGFIVVMALKLNHPSPYLVG
jgi:hypothetical protein